MREPDVSLPLFRSRCPLVYAWKSELGRILYVGISRRGLARPTGAGHHRIRDAQLRQNDTLLVWYCESLAQARQLEAELIRELRPALQPEPAEGCGCGEYPCSRDQAAGDEPSAEQPRA